MGEKNAKTNYAEKIIQFGNWVVTKEEIYWGGENFFYPPILINRLTEKFSSAEQNIYNWPIHLVSKIWLNEEDLKNFDLAFIFALDYFNKISIDQNGKLWKTLELQKVLIEERSETNINLD